MFLMMAEALQLHRLAESFPDNPVWQFLAHHQTHVEWSGCTLHDLIQPGFSFLVGVALPFSIASRLARGQSQPWMIAHAAWRALLLVLLGIFLRSVGLPRTNFTFEDTLSQIGLGYVPLFLLGLVTPKWSWLALGAILVGYWTAFAMYPLPGADFDYAAVGVPADWPHLYSGFAAHWNKNSNPAWAFDTWLLNLFPQDTPFAYNVGGYATLSFIPTLGTMILGLIAGRWLKHNASATKKIGCLVLAGAVCLAAGFAADHFGLCPSVKRIWTSAWILFSGGWCFLILAAFYATLDAVGLSAWAFPLRVIGMNSIAAYCMAHLLGKFVLGTFKTHLGQHIFERAGLYQPLVSGACLLAVYWLILYWMYRRKIFLRL